jgi:hypothetical protein
MAASRLASARPLPRGALAAGRLRAGEEERGRVAIQQAMSARIPQV